MRNLKQGFKIHTFLHFLCFAGIFSCKDLRDAGYARSDGEYYINPVRTCNRPISVYCHGMDTDHPRDYITLPSGPTHNYAIVYDLRMPRGDDNQCSGTPSSVIYSKSGTTRFKKVSSLFLFVPFVSCEFRSFL